MLFCLTFPVSSIVEAIHLLLCFRRARVDPDGLFVFLMALPVAGTPQIVGGARQQIRCRHDLGQQEACSF